MDAKTEIIKKLISNTGMSARKFAESIGIPNTTLNSMLSRGIGNASVNNVIKVCSALNICVESLYDMCKHNDIPLTNEENELLESFNKLNTLGKNEANKRVSELTQINLYSSPDDINKSIDEFTAAKKKAEELKNKEQYYKENSHLIPKASHDKEGNFTEEDYKHDDDLMMDDDLWK